MSEDRRPKLGTVLKRFAYDCQFDPGRMADAHPFSAGIRTREDAIAKVQGFQHHQEAEFGAESVDGFTIFETRTVAVAHVDRDGTVRKLDPSGLAT